MGGILCPWCHSYISVEELDELEEKTVGIIPGGIPHKTCPRCKKCMGCSGVTQGAIYEYNEALANLRDFEHKLGDLVNEEEFVRGFLRGIMETCPTDLLEQLGKLVLEYRKKEMVEQAKSN